MTCKYNKDNNKCTNKHNKTGYCTFTQNNQLNNCYYNPNSYQF